MGIISTISVCAEHQRAYGDPEGDGRVLLQSVRRAGDQAPARDREGLVPVRGRGGSEQIRVQAISDVALFKHRVTSGSRRRRHSRRRRQSGMGYHDQDMEKTPVVIHGGRDAQGDRAVQPRDVRIRHPVRVRVGLGHESCIRMDVVFCESAVAHRGGVRHFMERG